jgi:O-antigen ligase
MSSQVMYFDDRFGERPPGTPGLSLLIVPLALAGLVDFPGAFRAGTISALGVLGGLQVAIAVLGLFIARAYPREVLKRFFPYGLFLAWMFLRSLFAWPFGEGPDQGALQNGLAYTLLGVEFLIGATLASSAASTETYRVLRRGFLLFDVIALGLVALSLRDGLPGEGFEGIWWVSPRSLALAAIIPIGWHLACWTHGRRGEGLRALAWILAVFASLSRTVTAVVIITSALALAVHFWLTPSRFLRRTPLIAAGVLAVTLLVVAFQTTFYQRFFEGYTRVELAGISVSTSGRDRMWPIVIDSAMRHPILGGGLGSSQLALGEFIQPHNEYLRVWHDGGIVAVVLLVVAFLRWLLQLRRQYVWGVRGSRNHPEIELAALFALLGIMLAAITDNGFMYMFVDAPSGLLIGAAFGVRLFEAPSSSPSPTDGTEVPVGA